MLWKAGSEDDDDDDDEEEKYWGKLSGSLHVECVLKGTGSLGV